MKFFHRCVSRALPTAVIALASVMAIAQAPAQEAWAPGILIEDVRIFDGKSDSLSPPSHVLVVGNLISKISTKAIALDPNASVSVIKGGGRVLMPGLVDTHTHVMSSLPRSKFIVSSPWYLGIVAKINLENMLMRGFTTVRDMGGADGSIAQAVNEGLVAGPRVFPSGMGLSQTGGHFDFRLPYQPHPDLDGNPYFRDNKRMLIVVDGVDAVLRAARENLRLGATQIKIAGSGGVTSESDPLESTQFTPEEVRAAVAAAQAWGTYVVAHAYTPASVRMLIENGVKQIAHGHLLDEATIRLAAERGVAIETENVWLWVDEHLAKESGITPASLQKLAEVKKRLPQYFSLLKKHKIRVGFGTDILGPLAQFQSKEFTLRAQYFTPLEVLKQATSENYEIINMSGPLNRYGKFGVIDEGALADILLVNGNPLDNIALLEEPEKNLALIMKDGKIYKNQIQ